ncbi:MAG: DNA-processing protein DprA [Gemmataceae bacterium]|nr:DNA-processing protein DprA [Gemmataceae bacterium]
MLLGQGHGSARDGAGRGARPTPAARPGVGHDPAHDVRDLLALQLVPGVGPRLTQALLERFGSAAAIRRASARQLEEVPHIGPKLSRAIVDALARVDVDAELDKIARHGIRLLVRDQPGYPQVLSTIHDPPWLLYLRGSYEPDDARAIGMVGSRHGTAYGRRMAERLAGELSRAGFTIVSGLARGIDAAAHRGALHAGGRTLAVLAGGLSRIYPPEHAELAQAIADSGGLLSEASMDQEPMAQMFPARNRLISGLCRAVVIVEAAERSGALITAAHAAEQGREVFAVPGPIDSPLSAGTNELIRQGAKLVRRVEDILDEVGGVTPPSVPRTVVEPAPALDDQEQQIWEFLNDGPRHIDDIVQGLGIGAGEASRTLLMLEMKRRVRRLPGNLYERW